MPTYDYRCEANSRVVEVIHRLSETIETWGALCHRAGIELGTTSADEKVSRHITGGSFNRIKAPVELTSILPK